MVAMTAGLPVHHAYDLIVAAHGIRLTYCRICADQPFRVERFRNDRWWTVGFYASRGRADAVYASEVRRRTKEE